MFSEIGINGVSVNSNSTLTVAKHFFQSYSDWVVTARFYKVEPLLVGLDTHYIVRDSEGQQVNEITYETPTEAERIALRLDIINNVDTRYWPETRNL